MCHKNFLTIFYKKKKIHGLCNLIQKPISYYCIAECFHPLNLFKKVSNKKKTIGKVRNVVWINLWIVSFFPIYLMGKNKCVILVFSLFNLIKICKSLSHIKDILGDEMCR